MRERVIARYEAKLSEMSASAGDGHEMSRLSHSRVYREEEYENNKHHPVHSKLTDNISVHKHSTTKYTKYSTLDDEHEEAIHSATFNLIKGTICGNDYRIEL